MSNRLNYFVSSIFFCKYKLTRKEKIANIRNMFPIPKNFIIKSDHKAKNKESDFKVRITSVRSSKIYEQ